MTSTLAVSFIRSLVRGPAFLAITAASLWALAPSAHAGAIFGTLSALDAEFNIHSGGNIFVEVHDCLHDPNACGDGPRTAQTTSFSDVANSFAFANPTLGTLHAKVETTRSGMNATGIDAGGTGAAGMRSFWFDTFTIVSQTL